VVALKSTVKNSSATPFSFLPSSGETDGQACCCLGATSHLDPLPKRALHLVADAPGLDIPPPERHSALFENPSQKQLRSNPQSRTTTAAYLSATDSEQLSGHLFLTFNFPQITFPSNFSVC
jgi:hypothetical protein